MATKKKSTKKTRQIVAGAALLASSAALAGCLPTNHSGLSPEVVLAHAKTNPKVNITAGEYDAIVSAAVRWDIPVQRFGTLALCESSMTPNASNGSHGGLFQQSYKYWRGRVAAYNKATGENINGDVHNAFSNALVSAKMIHDMRDSSYSRGTGNGLPDDWIQCQNGWNGTNNKAYLWAEAERNIAFRKLTGQALVAEVARTDATYELAASRELGVLAVGLENVSFQP